MRNNLLSFIKEVVESVMALDEAKFDPRREFQRLPLDKNFLSDSLFDRVIYVREKARLKPLGSGSSRDVFLLDSRRVLKLASNRKGIGQNEAELDAITNPSLKPIFAKIYDYSPDFSWLISELVRPLHGYDEFKELSGIEFHDFSHVIMNGSYQRFDLDQIINYLTLDVEDNAYVERMEKVRDSAFVRSVLLAMKNGKILYGDLDRIDHWGKTADGRVALLDYGYTASVRDKFY